MSALDLKLLRDLWHMRGQALAIALVIASGVATFVMSLSTLDSLVDTQASFYADFRFAQVFGKLKRAPASVAERIREIPGVHVAETRAVASANLDIEGFADPATAQLVSLGQNGESLLNRIFLREGRLVDPVRDDEVVVSEAFALAHGFRPGDHLTAILNGRKKRLTIVGVGLSPEHVYQIRPGAIFPDFRSYAILWMAERPLATAFDLEGAFNDVAISLTAGASEPDVIERLDDILARYGGLGAYGRDDQLSHRFLSEEFKQLEAMATIFPIVFLSVAAFLLNVVFTRLIRTEREQVATLKAFGYSKLAISVHYLKFVAMIVAIGIAIGLALGVQLGDALSRIYMDFYKFPYLLYRLDPSIALLAAAISLAAAFGGALSAVLRAAAQPPAEAMRPEPPARYRRTILERLGIGRWISEPTRMIVRSLERHPGKAFVSALGIAASYAILMMGMFSSGAVDHMVDVQFRLAQRDDMAVTFVEPTSFRVQFELLRQPGVYRAEGFRAAPVRIRRGLREYRTSILGIEPGGDLYRILDKDLQPVTPPQEGLLLTDYLADWLGVSPGDTIAIEILEGARPVREVVLAGVVSQYIGLSGYMDRDALNRLLREGPALSGVYLGVDSQYEEAIYHHLKNAPRVAGVEVQKNIVESLYDTMAEQMLIFGGISTLLAGTIAFGVIYNSARIALAERSRELASLRVLGFTRAEASFILLGELGVITVAALPLGALLGTAMCAGFVASLQNDLFRIPLVIARHVYAYGALVVVICAILSGLVVRRRIDRLDLVEVLKTRE